MSRRGRAAEDTFGPPSHYRQLCAGRYESIISVVLLPGVTIARERINVSVMQETQTKAGNSMFIFPLAAIGGWRINGHHEQESVIALRQGRTELMTTVGAQSDLIALSFGPDMLPSPLARPGTLSFRRAPADTFLIDWIDSLIGLCASGCEFSEKDGRPLSELLAERLMDLATRPDGARSASFLSGTARYDLFRRVQAAIDRLPDEPVTLGALTRRPGVPMAEIHSAIRQCTGLVPAAWLSFYRFDRARRDLMSARRHGRRVSDIAMSWGVPSSRPVLLRLPPPLRRDPARNRPSRGRQPLRLPVKHPATFPADGRQGSPPIPVPPSRRAGH